MIGLSLIPLPYRVIAILAMVAGLMASAAGYHHHVFEQGVTQEKTRRDIIEGANTVRAKDELSSLNAKLRAAQSDLTKALADVATKQKDLNDEKAKSAAYQSDLLAGRQRMRILATCPGRLAQAGPVDSATAGAMDQGTTVEVDIGIGPAVAIDRLRTGHNEAVTRLDACIASYDAIQAAADKIIKDAP